MEEAVHQKRETPTVAQQREEPLGYLLCKVLKECRCLHLQFLCTQWHTQDLLNWIWFSHKPACPCQGSFFTPDWLYYVGFLFSQQAAPHQHLAGQAATSGQMSRGEKSWGSGFSLMSRAHPIACLMGSIFPMPCWCYCHGLPLATILTTGWKTVNAGRPKLGSIPSALAVTTTDTGLPIWPVVTLLGACFMYHCGQLLFSVLGSSVRGSCAHSHLRGPKLKAGQCQGWLGDPCRSCMLSEEPACQRGSLQSSPKKMFRIECALSCAHLRAGHQEPPLSKKFPSLYCLLEMDA